MDRNELDGKIAREIMGWVLDDDGYWKEGHFTVYIAAGTPADWDCDFEMWSPTTDWAHFGLVLEKAIARNPYLSLCLENGLDGKAYLGIFTTGSGYKQVTVEQWGDGPLEAACLAILEAWNA